MDRVLEIPLAEIQADPNQPRKIFAEAELRELAASIRVNGLLQPITVRANESGGYWVVAGERRFRAHQIIGAATVRALVMEPKGAGDLRVAQIIENAQRVDVSPLEEARAYQSVMNETGWTVEQLAARVGKAPYRITERTVLLSLRDEYQSLFASGSLNASQAMYMARLSPRAQDVLFRAIKNGQCATYPQMKACADALLAAEAQGSMMPEPEPVTEADQQKARSFEATVSRVAELLNASIRDNKVVALKRVNPDRAGKLADLLAVMQKDLHRIELALRAAVVQADLLAA